MNNISSFLIYGSNLNKMYITIRGLCKVDCGDGTVLTFNYIPTKNKLYECYDIKHSYKQMGYYLMNNISSFKIYGNKLYCSIEKVTIEIIHSI